MNNTSFSSFVKNKMLAEDSKDGTDYEIPSINLQFLQTKIDKLNKSAKKLGCSPVSMKVGDPFMKKVKNEEVDRDGNVIKTAKYQEFRNVTVFGEAPKLNGWTFVGKREPDEVSKAVFTKAVPGHNIPDEYADDHDIKCDHCKKNARRNESFIVKNLEGKHMEVGRSCLKDFLGHENPTTYANYAEALYDVHKAFAEQKDEEGFGQGTWAEGLDDLLPVALRTVKNFGFVPNNGDGFSTSMRVSDHFYPPKGQKPIDYQVFPTDEDKEEAKSVLEFMKNHPEKDKNDFWRNVSKMANAGAVSVKHFGYIAAAVGQYIKAKNNLTAKEKVSFSQEPIGNVGDKVKIKGSVVSAFTYQGQSFSYHDNGVRYILSIKTHDNKLVKMFTTNGGGIEKGDDIEISGKVGSFEEEKYEKSPFKGMMMTTMAPRSRIISSGPPEDVAQQQPEAPQKEDDQYHVGDTIRFHYYGSIVTAVITSKPTFGKFRVKSMKTGHEDHVDYKDIIEKV